MSETRTKPNLTDRRYRLAIRDAMDEEMARDERVFLIGQDIGASGGLFRLTEGLYDKYGPERVRDTPISEIAMIGAATGAALMGWRPVVEISFSDLIAVSFDAVVNQLGKIQSMFGSQVKRMPVVIRAMTGAGIGAGPHHSQSLEAWFSHTPGLKVVMPATSYDAKGLLKAAIRDDDPVIFLEHKSLLRLNGPVPGSDELVEIGKAAVVKEGSDVTVVGFSGTLRVAQDAAGKLAKDGINAEVIDLRTIAPLDMATILASVRKTGRLLVVQEAHAPMSVASEILARISIEAFDSLRAAPVRVTAPFVPIPANKHLEQFYIPNAEETAAAARTMMAA
jgi:pyruvate/2-oxoglutarate/acetoin dehydrogenase E1 component